MGHAISPPSKEAFLPVFPVKEIPSAIVLPAGLAMKGWRLIRESTFWDLPHDYAYRQRYAWYKRLTLRKAPEKIPEAILIHHPWANNLVFWIGESLPRLLHVPNYQNLPVLLPEESWPFTRDTLHLLGVKEIIPLKKTYFYPIQRLHLPMIPKRGSHGSYFPYLRYIVQVIRSSYAPPAASGRRIYISRARAIQRKIANEKEILPILEKFGFECVSAEDIPFSEQVALFSQAEVLLGMHGAGHAHLFWMPAGSLVVEVVSAAHRPWVATYANLSYMFGHRHLYLPTSPTPESLMRESYRADVTLPPSELEAFLRRIL